MTLASVVIDLDDGVMWVAEGTPCDTEHVPVALDPGQPMVAGAAA
jgi:hypothetical protein